ncbi:NAD-glutamate dehydrogenase [Streptomyces sp. ST2-7A]|uniref:NAD-glutamate dehydrogenase n=1 Tax=Streptomyces sp. ST2-7A TaxID=2907214 RepID=UPI001F33B1EA|nr:NAD-glutamate dehydrogenase [Streptomyces sp. ST2-7A]MCE7082387.1 NAD-glutamate dehydrogenase [Streptomyces sp. ST2-7A]
MHSKLDDVKAELLDRAAEVADHGPAGSRTARHPDADELRAYLQRYYLYVSPEDLQGRDPVDLYGAALSHRRLAARRPQGTADIRVHTPTVEEVGWTCSHTVVEVVTDDMPFLVDSVTNELSRQDRGIHIVIHPQMIVRRDVAGELLEVLDAGRDPFGARTHTHEPGELPDDAVIESWIHVEVDRETDHEDLRRIEADLRRVLNDVRESVEDWRKMRERALSIADELTVPPVLVTDTAEDDDATALDADTDGATDTAARDEAEERRRVLEIEEARELLRWLAADHFTFLGYREYRLVREDNGGEGDVLAAVPGTGLGILRSDPTHVLPEGTAGDGTDTGSGGATPGRTASGRTDIGDYHPGIPTPSSPAFSRLTPAARAKAREPRVLILTKANSRATVHRRSYLDYIGVKKFDAEGRVIGERRFLGLFSSAAYTESVRRVPVIRRKVAEVLASAGFAPDSHSGRDLLQILETYPRDELFQTSVPTLRSITTAVLHLQERRRLRLFLRQDEYGRYYSALVYLPRDRWTTSVRLRLSDILCEELGGTTTDFTAWNTESVLSRLHFVIRVPTGTELPEITEADRDRIEARLADASRSWTDGFVDALLSELGEEQAAELGRRFQHAFPEGYKADHPPRAAVADLQYVLGLRTGEDEPDFALSLYEPVGAAPGERRFKIYRTGEPVTLSAVLPVLQNLGVEVVDERPYELRPADGSTAWIYDFGLRVPEAVAKSTGADVRERFQEAFSAAWTGEAENDGINALVLSAGLTWRQAMVLRAYAKYLWQAGARFSKENMEATLCRNVHTTRLLVNLFEARLHPERQHAGHELTDGILEELDGALDQVSNLDEDRILRAFRTVIRATLRCNYFRSDGDVPAGTTADGTEAGRPRPYLSMKLDPQAIPDLPEPRPAYEIWVYSPRVEGVHLRFGKVARGGLRWSDRREDFRTEILGLVKAQEVKNTVIVPVGAKGGFVAKRLPSPTRREAWLAEGVACYRTFIRGLLDITDNLVDGRVVPPPGVVRHDGDDTYLVVAADKGTATFSDIANEVAGEYGFWLGDAFASGGSAGYDHKAMGITARGAWESVRRHFRELGHDTQTQDFTVVGIGDMSGDVFGNGMLLSEHIRLVAAFDHRHIFLDPDPDAEISHLERRRLFELPRSSWADYDTSLLSKGGGVHPRSAKSIPLTPQVRAALDIPSTVVAMTPADLMRAILRAPVDLLWNGGIGTYVKASTESHAAVGDRANDAIRVDGRDLRVKVIGEGGNLGLTQLGRIEFARSGGHCNTDAIDNSAGVDTSDHEVNIKILLNDVVANGDLTVKQRNLLLAEMTDEVSDIVLRNNHAQNVVLATSEATAPGLLLAHQRFIRSLEVDGRLDRRLEFLPDDEEISDRLHVGEGLTQPELAVLLAYAKLTTTEALVDTDLPEDPYLQRLLAVYFPGPLRERFPDRIERHALRREIITTLLVNDTINVGGPSFLHRLHEESGASVEEIVRAHSAARAIFGLHRIWDTAEQLANDVPATVLTRIRLHSRRMVERGARWLLNNRPQPLRLAETIEVFSDPLGKVWLELPKLLRGRDLEVHSATHDELVGSGVPAELAQQVAGFTAVFPALDVVAVADRTGRDLMDVAQVYYHLADQLGISRLQDRISMLPRADRWQSMARTSIREDLYAAHQLITADVLAAGEPGADPEEMWEAWASRNRAILTRARSTLAEIQNSDGFDLANLSVAMRTMRTLLRSNR